VAFTPDTYCPVVPGLQEASASYLKGDHNKVKEILAPLWQTTDYLPSFIKSYMAALEGDLDLALDYYQQALSDSEYLAIYFIQAPPEIRTIFPDYRSHPNYQKMLRDMGLDDESISKLKIPPLPF